MTDEVSSAVSRMKIVDYKDLSESFFEYVELEEMDVVKEILSSVKCKGDAAVSEYSKKFDNEDFYELQREDIKAAYDKVDDSVIDALKVAVENIRLFAQAQMKCFSDFSVETTGGKIGQRVVPLSRVGCYVPGGRYPLPSSALMGVIPAVVAGVGEVVVCSPKIKPATIVAADIAGASRIFSVGGVQAIGALAYGTKSVPRVDKIVGPGNAYVTAAKKEVYGVVGIDFLAGPSEVLVIADESGDARLIAADILAQCEHDPNARGDLITTSRELAEAVNTEIGKQLALLQTKDVASQALTNGRIVLVDDLSDAVVISNRRAPEHLELQVSDPDLIVDELVNYGSLFIGKESAEVLGDYCSGTNHILPTNGCARYTAGLSVKDFVRIQTYQTMTKEGGALLGKVASVLASIEGLDAHKKAADLRVTR